MIFLVSQMPFLSHNQQCLNETESTDFNWGKPLAGLILSAFTTELLPSDLKKGALLPLKVICNGFSQN